MMDDPKRWDTYRIVVPKGSLILIREKSEWYLTSDKGKIRIPVESNLAAVLAAVFATTHIEEDWIDRHSWQFHWWRFWYRRKKRRDQLRQNKHDPSTK